MITTTEIRWFYSGIPCQTVQKWFNKNCPEEPLQSSEVREDTYLLLPECEFLNLKYRQGRFELKWRKEKLGVIFIASHAEGLAQRWVKVSFEEGDEAMLPFETQQNNNWIQVKKQRSQCHYAWQKNGTFKAVNSDRDISQGGTVELTQLTVFETNWWTLAFEVFGPEEQQKEILVTLASDILKSYPSLALNAQDSSTYPMWLHHKAAGKNQILNH